MKLACLFLLSLLLKTSLALDFSGVPTCALDCTVPLLIKHNCNLTDSASLLNCLCVNIKVEAPISKCVRTQCNFTEIVAAKKSQDALCEGFPVPTRQPQLIAQSIVLTTGVIIFVLLRCYSRYSVLQKFWWDDWVLLAAAAFLIALQGVSIWGAVIGFGLHIWNVEPKHGIPLYKFLWVYELLYVVVQCLSKSSILLLYWRIFPQQWLRRAVVVLMTVAFFQGTIFTLTLLFLCHPIALNFDKSLKGKCLDLNAVVLAGGVICFLEDIIIWFLPIPSILRLRLRTSRKLAVVGIMGVGIIAVIASMIRLKYIVHFSLSIDQNWDDYGIAIMSSIELSISLMCICFPAIKPLLNRWFPNHFGSYDNDPNPTFSFNLPNSTPRDHIAERGQIRHGNGGGSSRPNGRVGYLGGILTKLSLTNTGWGLSEIGKSKGSRVDSGVDSETKRGNSPWLDSKSSSGGKEEIELGSTRSTEGDNDHEFKGKELPRS